MVVEGEPTVFRRRNVGSRLGDRRASIWRTGRAWILLEGGLRIYVSSQLFGGMRKKKFKKKEEKTYQIEHCAAGDLQVAHMEPPC